MPIPYMGSKRKSAHKIYATIKAQNPNADTIVDLFAGGFAIGEIFMQNDWTVIANDKNKYVMELLREAIDGRFNDRVFTPEFITRDMFNDIITNTEKYDDWYVGYVACIWSFGNNNKGYLFGKESEPIKKAGHELVINSDPTLINKLLPQIPKHYIEGILKQSDWHKRRLALNRVSKAMKTRVYELQRLQQLEQLQRLERLQQLEQLQRLIITRIDYNRVKIPKGAIVYCDPPYDGTAEYVEGGFNHKEFWQWARGTAKTNPIYISEYKAPVDFAVLRSWPQKSTLQGGVQTHLRQPDECLFTYREKLEDN